MPSDDDRTIRSDHRGAAPGERVVGVLIGINGRFANQVFPLWEGENDLGRAESCRVCLPDESKKLSRRHAIVKYVGGDFAITSVKREAVTLVNDEPIEGLVSLGDGDTLRLGDSSFKFRSVDG